jgi:hypothetical protein
MDDDEPSADKLYNYDKDRDSDKGLQIKRGGDGFDESSDTKHQRWRSDTFDEKTLVNGAPKLVFWSAMENFTDAKKGKVRVYLAATNGSDEAWLIEGTVEKSNWQGGSGTWVKRALEFDDDPSPLHIPAGYRLELVIVVKSASEDDMWFAYDTEDYDTRLVWPD